MSWNFTEIFLWNIWGLLEPISTRGGPPGGHNPPGRARQPKRALVGCAHLGPPPVPIFWYISHFDLEKIEKGLSGRSAAALRRSLGRSTFAIQQSDSPGNFPPGGGNHRHHHHQQLSHPGEGNLHQHLQQHHLLSNPSSSLVFNLYIGTSDWYLWVTSSVDYIL